MKAPLANVLGEYTILWMQGVARALLGLGVLYCLFEKKLVILKDEF